MSAQAKPSSLVGTVMGLKQALHANAPELLSVQTETRPKKIVGASTGSRSHYAGQVGSKQLRDRAC